MKHFELKLTAGEVRVLLDVLIDARDHYAGDWPDNTGLNARLRSVVTKLEAHREAAVEARAALVPKKGQIL